MHANKTTLQRAKELRQSMSPPEAALWQGLRGKRLAGLKFRRQHPVGPYILDFFCNAALLAVEVDGSQHDVEPHQISDAFRDHWLSERGIKTHRVSGFAVLRHSAQVMSDIHAVATARLVEMGQRQEHPLLAGREAVRGGWIAGPPSVSGGRPSAK